MTTIAIKTDDFYLLEKINSSERALQFKLDTIQSSQTIIEHCFQNLKRGLVDCQSKCLRDFRRDDPEILTNRIKSRVSQDSSLRYPHKKIMECLLSEFDFEKGSFKSLHFTELANRAHVCKGKAKNYLRLLLERRYLTSRQDGRRINFKVLETQ